MLSIDRFDSLIRYWWQLYERIEANADWRLAKAQMIQESSGDPTVVNRVSGAVGLFQLMPATATDLRLDRRNIDDNVRGGIQYDWVMWDTFRLETGVERWKLALGAYNAGPGHIIEAQRIAKAQGLDPSLWSSLCRVLSEVTGQHAAETIDYVAGIFVKYNALVTMGSEVGSRPGAA